MRHCRVKHLEKMEGFLFDGFVAHNVKSYLKV